MTTFITVQLSDEFVQQLQAEAQQQNTTLENLATERLMQNSSTHQKAQPPVDIPTDYAPVIEMFSQIRAAHQTECDRVKIATTAPLTRLVANLMVRRQLIQDIEIDETQPDAPMTLYLSKHPIPSPQYRVLHSHLNPPAIVTDTDVEALGQNLLEIVGEKTGYPIEMLELEMDMETDLGIDSIKRVEILGTVQERFPNLPQPNLEDLAELRTLGQIVDFLMDQTTEKKTTVLELTMPEPINREGYLDDFQTDDPKLKQILEKLRDPDPNIRIQGANALGDLGCELA
jgi:acyl carrier protein